MLRVFILIVTCLGFTQAAFAGGGSQSNLPSTFKAEDIAAFSKQVERALADQRALVAIVARNGRPIDQLPKGVHYTHVGFAIYSEIALQDGSRQKGYAFHNLYQSNDQIDRSELVVDLPPDFFAGAFELKAGVIIPYPDLQRKLYKVITGERYQRLHNPRYSAIANPFDTRLQNCTEFVMNVTQSALYDTDSLNIIKANLDRWFEPYEIPYGKTALTFASFGSPDISTQDQGYPYITTTFGSIVEYMEKYQLASSIFEVSNPDAIPIPLPVIDDILEKR